MFKPKTLIAILFSILMGILAVKALSINKKAPKPNPEVVVKKTAEPVKPPPVSVSFSQKIPAGMRVTTIKVNDVSGVTHRLKKNDRVDIMAVTPLAGESAGLISRIVLQNIEICGMEDQFEKENIAEAAIEKKKRKEWNVHVLVTPEQGAVLSAIDSGAKLRLLLRNQADEQVLDTCPTVYTSADGVISIEESGGNPTSLVKEGMRAVTLKIDDTDGICGTLTPGDLVDVIFSCKASRFALEGGNEAVGTKGEIIDVRKSSKILLQNVEVLTTRQALKNILETNTPDKFVTLSVTPSQAEKLTLITDSTKTGKIKLVARNRSDTGKVDTQGEFLEDILLKDKRKYRVIEVIKGSKKMPLKYYEPERDSSGGKKAPENNPSTIFSIEHKGANDHETREL